MAIEKLSLKDAVTASTVFAINVNGQDYRVLASDLLTYLEANISVAGAFVSQYSAPSATAFSTAITDSDQNTWLILTPVAGYADGEIVLPATANCVDGQEILVNCTQAVTTFVVDGNGSTVTGEPATLAANAYFRLRFDAVTSTWYRVG